MLRLIFSLLASVLSLYAIVCCVRIVLTWFPNATFHPVTKFLAKICDPFLDVFHKLRWLRVGNIDFSPAIAICLLGAASSILSGLANGGHLSLGIVLALLIGSVWSIISAVITFILLLLIIRLVVLLVNHGNIYSGNLILSALDQTLSSIVGNISRTFSGGKFVSYQNQLIISIVALVIVNFAGGMVVGMLSNFFSSLPF